LLRNKFGAFFDHQNYFPDAPPPLICKACGVESTDSLHLHELWEFDDDKCTQTLVGLKAICEDCHNAIHIGRANAVGLGDVAKEHLKKVNGWTDARAIKHIKSAEVLWHRRREVDFEIDVSWLIENGLLSSRDIHLNWLKRPQPVFDHVGAIAWAKEILALPSVVILDTETTGLIEGFARYPEAEIIELAIISTSGEVLYNKRFKPLFPIPSRATKIHGITNTMERRSPSFAKEFPKIMEILNGRITVTYNSRFDSRILANTCKLHKIPQPDNITWECAMRIFKAYLEPATRFVSLPNASHTALSDCIATLDLIQSMSKGDEIIRVL
jgi:DNA polymerase III epsilon subunit-like protein